ncbi:DinB family protein [Ornithinimicrobium flavum]|uniref:DinB family protein n=1 Tax=Ornithinimicrobium flavum TaxID=1288636 RepID=UPI00106FF34C|nr:DinB family protein [Ornithinimicrobium flavum]
MTEPETLAGRTFVDRTLRGSRFVGCDLSGVVVRGSEIAGMELDSPWLLEGGSRLLVNGVDVVPLVDAELDRRFPGRELRHAGDPDGLRAAWSALQRTWGRTLARVEAMPVGTVDVSVDGEWSFAQTLRHLVLATDTWLGRAVLRQADPFHPLGLADSSGSSAFEEADLSRSDPTYAEVLAARADRQRLVRDVLDGVTPEVLAEGRANPHAPEHPETVLSCLRTILEEEWEHHRYAVRDLDALAAAGAEPDGDG